MGTLDQALDMAMALSFEQRQMLIDILAKRQIEKRREEIADNAKEAIRAFHNGELNTETAEDLIRRLHDSPEDGNDSQIQILQAIDRLSDADKETLAILADEKLSEELMKRRRRAFSEMKKGELLSEEELFRPEAVRKKNFKGKEMDLKENYDAGFSDHKNVIQCRRFAI